MYSSTFFGTMEVNGQVHATADLPPGAHFIGGWVDPRAGLDDMAK
jgi:hypothetical protein